MSSTCNATPRVSTPFNSKMESHVTTPTHTDVLLGRGVTRNRHPGNKNFRNIVSQHAETYGKSTKKEKMMISRSIVKKVKTQLDPPGRFLEKYEDTGLWHEVDEKRALEKTAQALRDGAAPLKKKLAESHGDPAFILKPPAKKKKHRRSKSSSNSLDFLSSVLGPLPKRPRFLSDSDKDLALEDYGLHLGKNSALLGNSRLEHGTAAQSQSISSSTTAPLPRQGNHPHLIQNSGRPHESPSHKTLNNLNETDQKLAEALAYTSFKQISALGNQKQHDMLEVSDSNPSTASSADPTPHPTSSLTNGLQNRQPTIASEGRFCNIQSKPLRPALEDQLSLGFSNTSEGRYNILTGMGKSLSVGSSLSTKNPSITRMNSRTSSPNTRSSDSDDGNVASAQLVTDKNNVDEDEFAQEMGPDEHFFGLCNSDPVCDLGSEQMFDDSDCDEDEYSWFNTKTK